MRVYPQDEIESHHQEMQQSVFELWELSARTRTLWLFPMAPWPAVAFSRASATVPETMGQRETLWECALLQGSRPPPEKALSGHWERRAHRWPHTQGVALWEGTLLCVRVSISTSAAKAEGEAVVESVCGIGCSPEQGERERRCHLHKNVGSMTLFFLKKKKSCRCVKKLLNKENGNDDVSVLSCRCHTLTKIPRNPGPWVGSSPLPKPRN